MKSVLFKLNQLFPVYLILIVNFPLIIGLFLNYALVSSRLLAINLLWLTLFIIICRLFKSLVIYRIGVVIYGSIALIEGMHWIILKGPLSTSSLFVISATNYQESVEFLSIKIGANLILISPLFVLIYFAWKYRPSFNHSSKNTYFYGAFLLLFFGFIIENAMNHRLVRKGTPNIIKVAITFEEQMELFKSAKESKAIEKVDAKSQVSKQTVVLIIGESLNRNHMQLYGEKRPTTPLLSNRKDLHIFDNVVSSYSNTISSVLTSLSETALDNSISLNEGKDIMDVFSSAGYTNYWISNQSPIGIWENLVTVFARKATHSIFVNLSSSNSMESTLTSSYDELLFAPTQKVLKENDSLQFIVIHTMGNHSSYKSRYPSKFNKFSGENNKSQIIAEYHNSILYHDFVLDSLLSIIEKNTGNAVVIYAADHGENVYDEGDNLGHDYAGKLPKSNVEIPFFLWFSDEYRENNQETLDLVKSRKSTPYVTDHLFHTLIDLANIQTPIFINQCSFVNVGFNADRKRILEDGMDFDE